MNKLPQSRSVTETIMIPGVALLSFVLLIWLHPYWQFHTGTQSLREKAGYTFDSLLHASKIGRDTVHIVNVPVFDDRIPALYAQKKGVFAARNMLDTMKLSPLLLEYRALRGRDGEVFISTGNTARKAQREDREDGPYLSAWFDINGGLTGVVRICRDTLPFADTNAFLSLLQSLLPQHLQQWKKAAWQRMEKPQGDIVYTTEVSRGELYYQQLEIYAEPTRGTMALPPYLIGWKIAVYPRIEQEQKDSGESLRIAAIIAFIATIVLYVFVFILQLRKRAVSIWLCVLVSLLGAIGLLTNVLGVTAEIPLMAFFFLGAIFLLLGFIAAGMPFAGLISLLLEYVPEKFYTYKRLIQKRPWLSFLVGRSIMAGIVWGIAYAAVFPLFGKIMEMAGNDFILQPIVLGSYVAMIRYFSPVYLLISTLTWMPLSGLGMALAIPALAYRFIPGRAQNILVALSIVVSSAIPLALIISAGPVTLLLGICYGMINYYVYTRYDILALSITQLVGSVLFYAGALRQEPLMITVLTLGAGMMIVMGTRGYFQQPEIVSEEEYKPEFLSRLEEERRLKEELNAAKVVQQRLLPAQMPHYHGLDVAAICVPAFEVGGDYYDFFSLDEHRMGVLIGDVSGKGMSAAFYITLAKGVIVSQVQREPSPAEVLARVNALLFEMMERGKFISLIYGVYDLRTNEFTYAQAGHNPLLLRRAQTGAVEKAPAKGLALGLDRGEIFTKAVKNITLGLRPGDEIVLYTDGVPEAMSEFGREFGEDTLSRVVEEQAASAEDRMQNILTSVRHHMGRARQHDDITIVVVRAIPLSKPGISGMQSALRP
jgi:serine phosphatase RsbU (regulator of sigma subunit)